MTRIRQVGALALATSLATGSVLFAAPLPAEAKTAIVSPGSGSVIKSGSFVKVRAHYDSAQTASLDVATPDGPRHLDSGGSWTGGNLAGSLEIRRNGRYTVKLSGLGLSVRASSTFYVRIPPSSPSGVSASVSGGRLTVSWNLGLEDDLNRYYVKASGVDSTSGSPGGFCSGTSCSTSFKLSPKDSGTTTVSVRASRSNGTGGSVASGYASDRLKLPGTGGSGGTGNGTGGGGTGNLTPPPDKSGTDNQTPLTPFNEDSPVTLPSVQPDGTPPGFAYQTPQVVGPKVNARNVSATDSLQWGKSVAIAMVLLIIAAHLGTWTRRLRVQQAGVSSRGMAARIARAGTGRSRVKKMQEHIARAEASAKTVTLPKPSPTGKGARGGGTAVMPAPGAKKGKGTRFGGLVASKPRGDKPPATQTGPVQVNTPKPGTPPQRENVAGYEIISSDSPVAPPQAAPNTRGNAPRPGADPQTEKQGRHTFRRGHRRPK